MNDDAYTMHKKLKESRQKKAKVVDVAKELRDAYEDVGKTRAGVLVLQHIMALCHPFDSPAATSSVGDVCPNKLFYNIGRQDLWKDARRLMSRETLLKVEYPDVETKETKQKGE